MCLAAWIKKKTQRGPFQLRSPTHSGVVRKCFIFQYDTENMKLQTHTFLLLNSGTIIIKPLYWLITGFRICCIVNDIVLCSLKESKGMSFFWFLEMAWKFCTALRCWPLPALSLRDAGVCTTCEELEESKPWPHCILGTVCPGTHQLHHCHHSVQTQGSVEVNHLERKNRQDFMLFAHAKLNSNLFVLHFSQYTLFQGK